MIICPSYNGLYKSSLPTDIFISIIRQKIQGKTVHQLCHLSCWIQMACHINGTVLLGETASENFLKLSQYCLDMTCLQNALGTHRVRGRTNSQCKCTSYSSTATGPGKQRVRGRTNFQCKCTSYSSTATGPGNHQPTCWSGAVQHFSHSSGAIQL